MPLMWPSLSESERGRGVGRSFAGRPLSVVMPEGYHVAPYGQAVALLGPIGRLKNLFVVCIYYFRDIIVAHKVLGSILLKDPGDGPTPKPV